MILEVLLASRVLGVGMAKAMKQETVDATANATRVKTKKGQVRVESVKEFSVWR